MMDLTEYYTLTVICIFIGEAKEKILLISSAWIKIENLIYLHFLLYLLAIDCT